MELKQLRERNEGNVGSKKMLNLYFVVIHEGVSPSTFVMRIAVLQMNNTLTHFLSNKMADDMMNPEMVDDAIEIINEGIKRRKKMVLIINNRAGDNGPMIAQEVAKKLWGVKCKGEEREMRKRSGGQRILSMPLKERR